MKISNRDIYELYESISLLRQDTSLMLPVKTAFILTRNLKSLEITYSSLATVRNEIILANGGKVIEGQLRINPEDLELINGKLKEVLDIQTEIDLMPIKISDLGDCKIALQTVSGLYPIVSEES